MLEYGQNEYRTNRVEEVIGVEFEKPTAYDVRKYSITDYPTH